jgi:MerR family transcriptional regulator, thiopeptide resistance regulator
MAWSIVEVARMSGVTSRTLRHYDEIGLLPPSGIAPNGYRQYDEDALLRLQQILVLRELGLGLAEIRAVLDEQTDQVEALRAHHKRLLAEQDRLAALAATVARTIGELENAGGAMTKINRPENLFEGFDPSQYEAEARERWPAEYAQSQRYADTLTPEDTEQLQRAATAAMIRMAELMSVGTPVGHPAVQSEIDAVYQGVKRFWTPNAGAFRGLGQMYVDDERFRVNYDSILPGLAEYYRDAMDAYASERLN